jgi:MYXO-CTERM domain-containing protein
MNPETSSNRKNLKLALLAGTCLTTSASVGQAAVIINETADFANTHAAALLVPISYTDVVTVNGTVTSVSDNNDFVAFTNLLSGSAFTMAFTGSWTNFDVLDSANVHVGSPASAPTGPSASFTGTVPANGILVANVGYAEGNAYTINLASTAVPEPNAAALAGLGVAAAALRRNRRAKKTL